MSRQTGGTGVYLVRLLPPAIAGVCKELSPRALGPCVPGEAFQGKGVRASSFTAFSASPHSNSLHLLLLPAVQTAK